jgi:hypothetical protein
MKINGSPVIHTPAWSIFILFHHILGWFLFYSICQKEKKDPSKIWWAQHFFLYILRTINFFVFSQQAKQRRWPTYIAYVGLLYTPLCGDDGWHYKHLTNLSQLSYYFRQPYICVFMLFLYKKNVEKIMGRRAMVSCSTINVRDSLALLFFPPDRVCARKWSVSYI